MIRRVTIRDFQSLHRAVLDLGRFTVITGESDVGKSAVLRALRYAATNQIGQDFVRHGADKCGVQIDFADGATVAWVKGETAEYHLAGDGQTRKFGRFGRTVPAEVAQTLRIGEIEVGDDALLVNFHGQFSAPFLLDCSPSLRARFLGELSGINTLYLAVQEARRQEQAARRTQTLRQQDIERTRETLMTFDDIETERNRLMDVDEALSQADEAVRRSTSLRAWFAATSEREERRTAAERRLTVLRTAAASTDAEELESALSRRERLYKALSAFHRQHMRRTSGEEMLTTVRSEIDAESRKLDGITQCPTCGQTISDAETLIEHTEAA